MSLVMHGVQGTSRGGASIREIVKRIDLWGVNMLFVVGGNGGNAAANAIQAECEKCGVVCGVVGVPKSIDNDILLVCTLASSLGLLLPLQSLGLLLPLRVLDIANDMVAFIALLLISSQVCKLQSHGNLNACTGSQASMASTCMFVHILAGILNSNVTLTLWSYSSWSHQIAFRASSVIWLCASLDSHVPALLDVMVCRTRTFKSEASTLSFQNEATGLVSAFSLSRR